MCGGGRDPAKRILLASETSPEMPPSVTVPPDSSKVTDDQQDEQQEQREQEQPSQQGHSSSPANRVGQVKVIVQPRPDQHPPVTLKVIPSVQTSEDDDLQKAIAMSIQDQQQHMQCSKPGGDSSSEATIDDTAMIVSAEDREVSRALEESLKEFPSAFTKKKTNPAERKRIRGTPIGLVNIGNTCWFNVVCQPLFHLPGFREMILNYKPPRSSPSASSPCAKDQKVQSPKVSAALSRLFALMQASEQKFIAPNECVHLFQGGEPDHRRNEQEDVCEFIHKLLEKLEVEFNEVLREEGAEKESSGTSKDAQFTNPIMKLFYGQFSNDKALASEDYVNKPETLFGQYPLHVLKYGDIHDSILASMSGRLDRHTDNLTPAETSSEQSCSNPCDSKSDSEEVRQEQWFKILPPVLIFSLSRYEYSQVRQITEKVHNKFEFPELLFMDRYMESKKEIVQKKHVQVAAIKKQLKKLNHTLEQYQKFGSGENKYPLKDILTYSLQFAETGTVYHTYKEEPQIGGNQEIKSEAEMSVVEDSGPQVTSAIADVSLTSPSEVSVISLETKTDNLEAVSNMEVDSSDDMETHDSVKDSLTVSYGDPKSDVTTEELEVLQNCISRWEEKVRTTEMELCSHISNLETQLKDMYSEAELQQLPYRLHAVVVHEGQASVGHYWVYVRSKDGWTKFNDVQVHKSSWEELQQDSLGGQKNASAYCLMYTDTQRDDLLFPSPSIEEENLHDLLQSLPIPLQEYVKQSNLAFQDEITEWESKACGSSTAVTQIPVHPSNQESPHSSHTPHPPPTAPNSPDGGCISDHEDFDATFYLSVHTLTARILQNYLKSIVREVTRADGPSSDFSILRSQIKDVFMKILQNTMEKVLIMSKEVPAFTLPSILDFCTFLHDNAIPNANELMLIHIVLVLKQLAHAASPASETIGIILNLCSRYLSDVQNPTLFRSYKVWQNMYRQFLDSIWHFLSACKAFESGNYKKALPLLNKTYHLHQDLCLMKEKAVSQGLLTDTACTQLLNKEMVLEWRSKVLLKVNTSLIEAFKSSADKEAAEEVYDSIVSLLVPSLGELSAQNARDVETRATVWNQWVTELLEKELLSHCHDMTQQVLSVVLSAESAEKMSRIPTSVKPLPHVCDVYGDYKFILSRSGINTTAL